MSVSSTNPIQVHWGSAILSRPPPCSHLGSPHWKVPLYKVKALLCAVGVCAHVSVLYQQVPQTGRKETAHKKFEECERMKREAEKNGTHGLMGGWAVGKRETGEENVTVGVKTEYGGRGGGELLAGTDREGGRRWKSTGCLEEVWTRT